MHQQMQHMLVKYQPANIQNDLLLSYNQPVWLPHFAQGKQVGNNFVLRYLVPAAITLRAVIMFSVNCSPSESFLSLAGAPY